MIGGRLTVSSYVNWPYGWGIPLSQIDQRQTDIDNAYQGTTAQLEAVVKEYKVSYVYVGNDEMYHYPGCTARFNAISWLKPVYTNQNLEIYQVELNQIRALNVGLHEVYFLAENRIFQVLESFFVSVSLSCLSCIRCRFCRWWFSPVFQV